MEAPRQPAQTAPRRRVRLPDAEEPRGIPDTVIDIHADDQYWSAAHPGRDMWTQSVRLVTRPHLDRDSQEEIDAMNIHWIRKPVLLGLGLSATLAVALAGCGGEGGNKDEGVLVPAPDANVNAKATRQCAHDLGNAATGGANGTRAPAPHRCRSPPPSRPRAGERSRDGRLRRHSAEPKVLQARARPRRTPTPVPRRRRSCPNGSSWTGHQGRQERLRLPPSAHRGQSRGQEGGRVGQARVRPEGLHLQSRTPWP